MRFIISAKNFTITPTSTRKLDKTLERLRTTLKSFSGADETAQVVIEKRPRTLDYIARVNFRLPEHTVATSDFGISPENALRKASEDARDRVLKIKDRFKDIHERLRRGVNPRDYKSA